MVISVALAFNAALSSQASCCPSPDKFDRIGARIQQMAASGDTTGLRSVSDSLRNSLRFHTGDSLILSDIYYFSGVCDLFSARYNIAMSKLGECISIRKKLGIEDDRYANAIFNAGTASSYLGNFLQVIEYMNDYAELIVRQYGENAPQLAEAYSALAAASIECLDYEDFIDYSFRAQTILNNHSDALDNLGLSRFYNTVGAGYARMGDYAKARIYLEKAESVILEKSISPDENYINLINSLAVTYGHLGLSDKETEFFSRGIDLAVDNNTNMTFNLIYNYASTLARSGDAEKGERLLSGVAGKAIEVYGHGSRSYIEVLNNYAGYLSDFTDDIAKTSAIYDTLLTYIGRHEKDVVMRSLILSGYANMLFNTGDKKQALVIIRDLLFNSYGRDASADVTANPSIDSIAIDRSSLRLLQLKYEILQSMYSESGNIHILERAAETSELVISLLDRIRYTITEEESRLILGDNFRNSYLTAIRDFELCYRKTGDSRYLEKAFEYAEKSKVAGLLSATRQMKAVQFHIPDLLAEKEKELQRKIGFYNFRISQENDKEEPDTDLLAMWKQNLLDAVTARDALILTFEKDYPGYFSLKYSNRVPGLNEIPKIIGKGYNYLNYVVSDTMLYVFLVNKKHSQLVTVRTDSSFLKSLEDFRNLLSYPLNSEGTRTKFRDFQKIAYGLYQTLIEPVKKYFLSDNLMISPDNILSYLPFETFISSTYDGTDIIYRKLDYLMNNFNISYVYSATFLNENMGKRRYGRNKLVAFAPSYPGSVNIDSLLAQRQSENYLLDLPYARQEAEYVTGISGGALYLSDEAREDIFKSVAAKYSIIHLAMHTVVNDQSPMNSAMIFAPSEDSINDGLLRTYEVYGIPLRAKMVVLSSCNTGTGLLSSGEGILSLARGFLYSGSQSVVMSLWKIEDRSGTEIIKMFYDNIRKGMTKSVALRKARNKYLKNSSQLRSHPYFWSALVVFGDNSAVYFPRKAIAGSVVAIFVSALLAIYLKKRRYS
jgi:CHAT domain-containing protein